MRLVHETTFPISPASLFELHSRPEALRRLSPSFPPVQSVELDGGFEAGTVVRIRVGLGPLAVDWTATLEEVVPGKRFVDVQKAGPFRRWRREHSFKFDFEMAPRDVTVTLFYSKNTEQGWVFVREN